MREQPPGDALLEIARQVLRDELMPALPADRRHAAMMVANAMAIAMRQFRSGDRHERREIADLERLLGLSSVDDHERDDAHHGNVAQRLHSLNRALSRHIREAPAVAPAIHAHLLQTVRQALLDSNPKYLGVKA